MRTLFDQYQHPENRLTHALAASLAEDPELLRAFLNWLDVAPPRGEDLAIVEQRLPGQTDEAPEASELEGRRLPDAWIYTASGWALLIESKIASQIDVAQLRGHLAMAEHRGFADAQLLILSPMDPRRALPDRCRHRCWSDVYAWASQQARGSPWASHLARYFPIAEQRMVGDGYLREGTLTTFAGIPFSTAYPYTYLEAKRVLKLLMAVLRADGSLDAVGIDRAGPGRPALTEGLESIWDFLPLTLASAGAAFTRFPHFTVSIQRNRVIAALTLPNDLDGTLRRRILEGGYDAFKATVEAFVGAAAPLLTADPGATPVLAIYQRRYASQRSVPVHDAMLEFDPRTAGRAHATIKCQEEWLKATYEAFASRRSNLQLTIGVAFPYAQSRVVHSAGFAEAVAAVARALGPLFVRLQGEGRSLVAPQTRRRRVA